jgi:chitin synthase
MERPDLAYDDALHNLKTRPKIIPAQKTASQRDTDKQDYYRNVRVRHAAAL